MVILFVWLAGYWAGAVRRRRRVDPGRETTTRAGAPGGGCPVRGRGFCCRGGRPVGGVGEVGVHVATRMVGRRSAGFGVQGIWWCRVEAERAAGIEVGPAAGGRAGGIGLCRGPAVDARPGGHAHRHHVPRPLQPQGRVAAAAPDGLDPADAQPPGDRTRRGRDRVVAKTPMACGKGSRAGWVRGSASPTRRDKR